MSANIEELVKKYAEDWRTMPAISAQDQIRNALTEQAEAFKGELQAYDGTVRELTKTVEDMRAAQAVADHGMLEKFRAWKEERIGRHALIEPLEWFAGGYTCGQAQSVAVVGEPVACFIHTGKFQPKPSFLPEGQQLRRLIELGATIEPLIVMPTHSIPAAELAALRDSLASAERERDALRKDAERYLFIRNHKAFSYIVHRATQIGGAELDRAIDAAIAQEKGE